MSKPVTFEELPEGSIFECSGKVFRKELSKINATFNAVNTSMNGEELYHVVPETLVSLLSCAAKAPSQEELYFQSRGVRCVNLACRSPDISGSFVQTGDGVASQSITCDVCGSTWTDNYQLVGVSDIEIGENLDEPEDRNR